MKYTKIILLTLTLSLPLFGCGKKEEPVAPPVTEETVEEIEPTEPVEEATDQQDGLNEGQALNRGDTNTVNSGSGSDVISIGGNDVDDEALKAAEEAEQAEEQTTDNNKNSSDTNGGKGFDYKGKQYDTLDEYLAAIDKDIQSEGVKSPEQSRAEHEAMGDGFVDYN